jgi:hypothetical protein
MDDKQFEPTICNAQMSLDSTTVPYFERLPPEPDFEPSLQSMQEFLNPIVQITPADSVKRRLLRRLV